VLSITRAPEAKVEKTPELALKSKQHYSLNP
jgi:hypothetical protein